MQASRMFVAVVALAWGAGVAHADLTTGLVARWELDGNALDSSPNANHGTPNATMVATTDRFGTPGGAYEFNGTNSFITVPNSASLASPSTAITMSAWIMMYGNSKVGSPFGPILMKSVEGANAFMYRMLANPTYFGSCYNNWTLHQSAGASIPPDTWHHVATTFDGAWHRFYFDGAQVDSQALALTITPDTRALTIGADYPGAFEVFWGRLDDVRIYNRRLGRFEIAELHTPTVGVGDAPGPASFAIRRVFPLPAAGPVTLEFTLPGDAAVTCAVHDVLGRRVRSFALGRRPGGAGSVVWDGRTDSGAAAGPGLYFVRLTTPGAQASARVVRIE